MSSAVAESPLASRHAALGARMIPFAGWNLPVEYGGLLSEHKATRQAAGLFDISHMGQIHALGAGALSALETLLANDAAKLKDGEGHYTFFLNDQGGVIDDLFLYRISAEDFLLVVNASRHREVLQLLKPKETPQVHFRGQPGTTVGMALQGRKQPRFFKRSSMRTVQKYQPETTSPLFRSREDRFGSHELATLGKTGLNFFPIS